MTLALAIGARVRGLFRGASPAPAPAQSRVQSLATEVARLEKALVHLDEDVLPHIGENHPARARVVNEHAAVIGDLLAAQAALREAQAQPDDVVRGVFVKALRHALRANGDAALDESLPHARGGETVAPRDAAQALAGLVESDGLVHRPTMPPVVGVGRRSAAQHQGFADGGPGDAVAARDRGHAPARFSKRDGFIDGPPKPSEAVVVRVSSGRDELEVGGVVVQSVPVSMMNVFRGKEASAEHLLHHEAMLKALPSHTVDHDADEAVGRALVVRKPPHVPFTTPPHRGATMPAGHSPRKARLVLKARGDRGGPGSQGGHVVGYTKTGEPIYARANHPGHTRFTQGEHHEAAAVQKRLAGEIRAQGGADARERAEWHNVQAGKHLRRAVHASVVPDGPVPNAPERVAGADPVRAAVPDAWLRLNPSQLLEAARAEVTRLAAAHVVVEHPELGAITFSADTERESLHRETKSRGELLAVADLPRLLPRAIRTATAGPRKADGNIRAYHYLALKIAAGGPEAFVMNFTVRADGNGRLLYSFRRAHDTRVTRKSADPLAYSPEAIAPRFAVAPSPVGGEVGPRYNGSAQPRRVRPMRVIIKARSLRPGRADEVPHDEVAGHVAGYGTVLQAAVEQLTKAFPGEVVAGRLQETATLAGRASQPGSDADAEDVASVRLVLDSTADHELAAQRIRRLFKAKDAGGGGQGAYRGVHLTMTVQGRPVEVQIRTTRQTRVADALHALLYRAGGKQPPTDVVAYLRAMSAYYAKLDAGDGSVGEAQPPECPETAKQWGLCLEDDA